MAIQFEWDKKKAGSNYRKHRVSFEDALTIFADPLSLTSSDPGHSFGESRYVTVGREARGRLLVVAHTDRADKIRLLSARRATRREIAQYEET